MWAVSSKTLGFYLVAFWAQCALGIALTVRREFLDGEDGDIGGGGGGDLSSAFLDSLSAIGPIGFGAAVTSLTLSLALEAILVLAELWRRRQYDKGVEEGVEIGAELNRRQNSATLREWAKERGIPADDLPDFAEPPDLNGHRPDR